MGTPPPSPIAAGRRTGEKRPLPRAARRDGGRRKGFVHV